MKNVAHSRVLRSLPALVVVVMLTTCSGSIHVSKSATPGPDASGATTTVSLPDGYTKIPLDGDDGMDRSTWVWAKVGGQRFDFEPTTCTVDDDGSISVVGPGEEQVSGKDAHLKVDIKKDGSLSNGTITFDLGANAPGGDGKVYVGEIGGADEYSISSYSDTITEITVELKDEAGTSNGKGDFYVGCTSEIN